MRHRERAQKMRSVTQEPNTEENMVHCTSAWLLTSMFIYFRGERARGLRGGLINVKINEKLRPVRNTLDKNTASDVLL